VNQDQIIIQSPERLVHFQCPRCEGWWSIGDAPDREFWFCPWCGERSLTKDGTVPAVMSDEKP
jgi:hypothetical protein